jgi:hypothetical protein
MDARGGVHEAVNSKTLSTGQPNPDAYRIFATAGRAVTAEQFHAPDWGAPPRSLGKCCD